MSDKFAALRRRAEEMLESQEIEVSALKDEEVRHIVQDLQVHRVELEMQNDELQRANRDLELAHRKYVDLFEFAPVGYVRLDRQSAILEANRAFLRLVRVPKGRMATAALTDFLAPGDQDAFYLALGRLRAGGAQEKLDVRMLRTDAQPFWAHLEISVHDDGGGSYLASVSDLTQQKDAEQRYQFLSDVTFEGILVHINGVISDVNASCARITGYDRDDLIGRDLFELLAAPEDRETSRQHVLRRDPGPYSVRMRRKDGRVFDAELEARNIDHEGQTVRIVALRDISDRKKAEAALRQSEERFRQQFESTPIPTFLWQHEDGQFVLFDYNPTVERITHGTAQRFVGMSAEALYPDRPDLLERFRTCLRSRQVIKYETAYHTRGTHMDRTIIFTYVYVPPGMIMLHTEDISERKRAVEDLLQSEERFRAVWDTTTDALALSDADGTVLEANPAYLRLYGYTRDEILGKSFAVIFPPEQRQWALEQYHAAFAAPEPPPAFESEIQRSDGTTRIVESRIGFLDKDGQRYAMLSSVRDITERKQAEQALQESEERLELALQGADLGVWDWAVQTGDVVFNQRWAAMLDYTLDEIEPRIESWTALVHPDDLPRVEQLLADHLEGRAPLYDAEFRMQAKTGEWRWVLDRGKVLERDAAGRPLRAVGTHLDVTGRKQAEAALKESEERFKNIANSVPGLVLRYQLHPDDSETLLFVSDGVRDMYEVTPEEAMADVSRLWTMIHPEDLEAFAASVKASAATLSSWEFEHRLFFPDGRVKWVRDRGLPKRQPDGSIIWDTLGIDITAQKQAEEALHNAHVFLNSIIDNSLALIVAKDLGGRYILANRIAEDRLELPRGGMLGKTDADLFPPDMAEQFTREDRHVVNTSAPAVYEQRIWLQQQWRTLMTTKFPLYDGNGQAHAVCAMATDITERKQAEDDLQEALAEKEVLLQEIHHRVKNNMQTIAGLLYKQQQHAPDQATRAILEDSIQRVRSMALIHEQIYRSRNLARVNMADYIHSFAQKLLRSYTQYDQAVALRIDAGEVYLPVEQSIPVALIVNELISNALKYAFPAGGDPGEISIECRRDASEVVLRVADTGVGLPDGVDITRAKTLGWYLVYNLATKQLGGRVEIRRNPGTECEIRFPA